MSLLKNSSPLPTCQSGVCLSLLNVCQTEISDDKKIIKIVVEYFMTKISFDSKMREADSMIF